MVILSGTLTLSNIKKSTAASAPNIRPMTSIKKPANTAPPYPLLNIFELVMMPLNTQAARMQHHKIQSYSFNFYHVQHTMLNKNKKLHAWLLN